MEEREKEIDIIDLCCKVMKKWIWMLVFGVLLAVICTGLKYRKDKIKVSNSKSSGVNEAEAVDKEKLIESMKDNLTEEQYSNVMTYISLYERINAIQEAQSTELIYKIDPNHVKKLSLTYAVVLPDSTETNTSDSSYDTIMSQLVSMYSVHLVSSELIDKITDEVDIKEDDLRSLITVYSLRTDESLYKNGSILTYSSINTDGLIYVDIIYYDEIDIDKIGNIIKDNINRYSSVLQKDQKHDLVLVDESYKEVKDDTLVDEQYDMAYKQYNLQLFMTNLEKNLDNKEKEYIKKYIGNEKTTVNDINSHVKPDKKTALFGLFVGIILACVWETIQYIMSGKIHTSEELTDYYGLRLFGVQSDEKNSEKLYKRWVHNLRYHNMKILAPEEQREIIVSNIELYCKQNNLKELVFTGTDIDLDDSYLSELRTDLEKAGIRVIIEKNIFYYPKSLQNAADIANTILFEKIESTLGKELDNVLKKAKEYDICVLGVVAFTTD